MNAYIVPAEVDVAMKKAAILLPAEAFGPGSYDFISRQSRAYHNHGSRAISKAVEEWRTCCISKSSDLEMQLPDPLGGGTQARVLVMLPIDERDGNSGGNHGLATLRDSQYPIQTLYRMLIFQNRLPLHWCLPCAAFRVHFESVYQRASRRSRMTLEAA